MSSPNTELEAVLASFAKQPGVTAEQQVQLRATVTQNPHLLDQLNQAAANGQLREFRLPPAPAPAQTASGQAPSAPSPPNLVGSYNIASGSVTLPANSLAPQGNADLIAVLRVQEMIMRFAQSSYADANKQSQPVTQNMVDNLQSTLNGSPVLAQRVDMAVVIPGPGQQALLRNFALLGSTATAGGSYNDQTGTTKLPSKSLAHSTSVFANSYAANLTFTLGHETQHAFNSAYRAYAFKIFETQVREIARSDNPLHDYTAPIEQLLQARRDDEAMAQIAGWNALLSKVQQSTQNAGLNEMWKTKTGRVLDFIEWNSQTKSAQARPGLTFNKKDGSLPMTLDNIDAVGQIFFDVPASQRVKDGTGIGPHGDSDYPNLYGTDAINRILAIEKAEAHLVNGQMPAIGLNMGQLHFDRSLIERNGISTPINPTTGQHDPVRFLDLSTSPPTWDSFHDMQHQGQTQSQPVPPGTNSSNLTHSTLGSTGNPYTDKPLRAGTEQAGGQAFVGLDETVASVKGGNLFDAGRNQAMTPAKDMEKIRLLVMGGQRTLQVEQDGVWTNREVDKAGALKPNFYNLYLGQAVDKEQTYTGVFVHADAEKVYQQTGKSRFVVHARTDFDEAPEIGSAKSISYDTQGRVNVSEAAVAINLSRGRSR